MEFIPHSGVDAHDLKILADKLIGTQDDLINHVSSLGTEIDCLTTLYDDLSFHTSMCDECGIWSAAEDLETGLCLICYEELTEIEDMLFDDDDFDDDFGFDDGDFDDDDILDEMYSDCIFDETDEDEDEDDI